MHNVHIHLQLMWLDKMKGICQETLRNIFLVSDSEWCCTWATWSTWTLSASTAEKRADPIDTNSRKTPRPYQHQLHKNTWTTISINSRKTHGPLSAPTAEKHMDHYQHQLQKNTWTLESTAKKIHGPQQKNTWTLSASTAEKRMDPISTKTHGCYRHQQHKNTWMLST